MNRKLRGFACIINNHKFLGTSGLSARDGTEVDCSRLKDLFEQLHFKVKIFNDVSAAVSKLLSLFVLSPVARRFFRINSVCVSVIVKGKGKGGKEREKEKGKEKVLTVMKFSYFRPCPNQKLIENYNYQKL